MIRPGRKKGLGKDYHSHNKTAMNYGGWGCPCCNPYGTSPRKMKVLARRLVRRTNKMKLEKENDQEALQVLC